KKVLFSILLPPNCFVIFLYIYSLYPVPLALKVKSFKVEKASKLTGSFISEKIFRRFIFSGS
ncbi:MAG TPA: hypothetical protein VLN72_10225, partial [Gillisia sp.]|nr:hypothetical protein [Gillisia sp.]